ncbi:MAG: IS66 family transposase [Sphaerochaetaceae bacterium]|jgi:transposase
MKTGKITKEDLMKMDKEEMASLVINLSSIIQAQSEEIANLKELYKLKTAERYIPSSEQMGWLFQELEILDAVLAMGPQEEETSEVASHTRKKRKRLNACTAPADTPVCDVFHNEDATESIVGKDGIAYKRVEDKVVDKIAIIPRKVVVERHHYPQYKTVDVDAGQDNNKIILYPSASAALGASPSIVSDVVLSKFDDHLPLYRQEEIFAREGFFLSRQKLASWVIRYYEDLLPFASYYRKQVYQSAFLSKDETRVTVLDVKGSTGKPSTNGFMYITIADTFDEATGNTRSLVLLDYIQGRSREVLFEDIERYGYRGYLLTDVLNGYLSYPSDKHCVCWVHAVRKLKQLLKVNKKNVHALRIINEAAKLYKIDERYRKMLKSKEIDAETFLSLRREESERVIDTIYEIVDEVRQFYSHAGAIGDAVSYLENYRIYMKNYLDVVEATPSTNANERVAKSFALGRRNWLFAQTVDGADASAFFFSIIETAKRAGLRADDYLEAICTFGPGTKSEAEWEALMPDKVDLARLIEWRERRLNAKPDSNREKPYHFVGATR